MTLSPDRLDRFARHIVLPEIGGAGQVALGEVVLEHDAGGLGGSDGSRTRVGAEGRQARCHARDEGVVVGEDHVLLGPEGPEERAAADPGVGRRKSSQIASSPLGRISRAHWAKKRTGSGPWTNDSIA